MKTLMLVKITILIALQLFCSSSGLFAGFEDIGAGARPISMGNAFTALADDVHTAYYNPAGLGSLSRVEFTSEYARLYYGMDDDGKLGVGMIAYVQPVRKWGTFGFTYMNMSLQGEYSESTTILSFGRRVAVPWLVGVNLKILNQSYGLDEYTIDDPVFGLKNSVTKASFDVGVLHEFNSSISAGLIMTDINQPDFLLYEAVPGETSRVCRGIRVGVAYKEEFLNVAIDAMLKGNNLKIYSGIEKWFYDYNVAVRGGLGLGTNEFKNLTLGASYRFKTFQVDYAFIAPLALGGTAGTHRLSLTLSFGVSAEEVRSKMRKETLEYKIEMAGQKAEQANEEAIKAMIEAKKAYQQGKEQEELRLKEAVIEKKSILRDDGEQTKEPKSPVIKEKKVMHTYIVKDGDTLQSVAEKVCGDASRWVDIYNANKFQIRRGSLNPGQTLIIP